MKPGKHAFSCRPHTSARLRRTYATARPTLGVRREDPSRIWERRCPLTPEAVHQLVHEAGIDVLVQSCERRIFKDDDFVKAGATLHRTLHPAQVIIGIKETPLRELLTNDRDGRPRTHVMFSHTHKGQMYNMPLLSRFLKQPSDSGSAASLLPTLVDWELLTDNHGKRTVGFGWYAGVAGALEGLVSTAHLHLSLGVASPFLGCPRPHMAPLSSLMNALRDIGSAISRSGMPKSMGPFVIVVTGSGQVSTGALDLLRRTLPIQEIDIKTLPNLVKNRDTSLNKVYLVHATQEKYLFQRNTGEPATREEYYRNPSIYESRFHELVAPYMTLLINGVGWTSGFPRLMTVEQTAEALRTVQTIQSELVAAAGGDGQDVADIMKGRCLSFADVSCDIGGGLEFLTRSSTLSDPSFFIDLQSSFPRYTSLHGIPPLQMMSVDILPTALPLEASQDFCKGILPYVKTICEDYAPNGKTGSSANDGLRQAIKRATIASSGVLAETHHWLQDLVNESRRANPSASNFQSQPTASPSSTSFPLRIDRKNILLLGSGMVAGPAVEEISRRSDVNLMIASDQPSRLAELEQGKDNVKYAVIDSLQSGALLDLIKQADIVISLLPVPLHPTVAEMCIEHQKHLVTASYISPSMKALDQRAQERGVLLLNEIGLDPGIDHCSTLALLASLRSDGKKVLSYSSFCGGLPAPECANVPLKYKFSWSPRGVLGAALNGANFLLDGNDVTIPSEKLLQSSIRSLPASEILQLEGLPNRDSTTYESIYDLRRSDGVKTVFRGTLRYPGFSQLLYDFKQMGLLDTEHSINIKSYDDLFSSALEKRTLTSIPKGDAASLRSAIHDVLPSSRHDKVMQAIKFFTAANEAGIPTSSPPTSLLPAIDHFASLLSHKLAYKPYERDLVLMHHELITAPSHDPTPTRSEVHTSSLEVYGTAQHTAMAICVGLPVAIAALNVLDGKVKGAGVHGPTDPALYLPLLDTLDERGIRMRHSTRSYEREGTVEGRLMDTWGANANAD